MQASHTRSQHLICVSRHNYPESILEKAQSIGSTVRLVQLELDNPPEKVPVQLFNSRFNFDDFQVTKIKSVKASYSKQYLLDFGIATGEPPNVALDLDVKIIKLGDNEPLSLYDLAKIKYSDKYFNEPVLCDIDITEKDDLSLLIDDGWLKVNKMSITIECRHRMHEIEPSLISYEQVGDGPLAWVAKYDFQEGKRALSVSIQAITEGDDVLLGNIIASSTEEIRLGISIGPTRLREK